jgi:hypothetical protein
MKRIWKKLARLGPIGLSIWMAATARAQDEPQRWRPSSQMTGPGDSAQTLPGYSFATSVTPQSPAAVAPRTLPTMQSPDVSNQVRSRGRASIAQLSNPFEWGGGPDKRGLIGLIGPQPSPQYPAPLGPEAVPGTIAAPGALPGPPAEQGIAPGAAAMPGAGAAPGAEAAPGAPPTGAALPPTAGAEALAAAAGAAGAAGFGGGLGAAAEAFPMIGDQAPLSLRQNLRFPPIPPPIPPGIPTPGNNPAALTARSVAAIVPAVPGVKIADCQYPRPVDRVWTYFNYFDGINSGINNEIGAPIKDMQVYKETFGFEKTFLDRQASIGFRLPLDTLTITSAFPGMSGTHTSTGNFSSFVKYALYDDGPNFLSMGLDLNFPTGPKTFAGFPTLLGINPVTIQPFMGYILQRDRLYVQGFNSVAVPTDRRVATMYYCDIGLGYYVYRSRDPRSLLSFLVPVFETHLNIPFNWVGFQPRYIGATPDVVDLTFGLNIGVASRAVLSLAYVRPVTGPLPFTGEFAMMLNIPFGGRPGRAFPLTPPPLVGQ